MALAELVTWKQYERTNEAESDGQDDVFARKTNASAGEIVFPESISSQYEGFSRQLLVVRFKASRPVAKASEKKVNRPSLERWATIAIDVTVLLSFAVVVTGFFVFLLELSAGRPAFLLPSFSAFFIFSIVGLVAFRLKRAVGYLQSDRQSL